jgi:hypothetical protein
MASFITAMTILALTLSGCLYKWHDYQFKPEVIEHDGIRIRLISVLMCPADHSGDKPYHVSPDYDKVDGAIKDSTGSFWDIEWFGNVDDSLRPIAHLECDSVSLWVPGNADTLRCNTRQDMTGGRWAVWKCGHVSYRQLNSRDIQLRMIIYMVFSDGRSPRRFEVTWNGQQRAYWIHSDY